MITVFTPTYNRAHTLFRLYQSLVEQTFKDFEWLIVDDGSSDDTEQIVNQWIEQKKIDIHYYKQENGGKHIAINQGVVLAQGELFFIVDSDDQLPAKSLEMVLQKYQKIKNNTAVAGIGGRKGKIGGGLVGTQKYYEDVIKTSLELRLKDNIQGDMAEIYKTEILKQYTFPKFEGEKFCPEALVWQEIDQKYTMLWFSEVIYECEYLEGGLTGAIVKIRKNSPKATSLYYANLSKYDIPFIQKLKAVANYWRFAIYDKVSFRQKLEKVSFGVSILVLPLSLLLILKDYKK